MVDHIYFTVLGKAQPQGSIKSFMIGGKPRLTSDNTKMKPYRQQVGWSALGARAEAGYSGLFADKHVAVGVDIKFYFAKPPSISKKRIHVVVKPDIDKICRSSIDAMTGILYADDSQIISLTATKEYGIPERVEISVTKK